LQTKYLLCNFPHSIFLTDTICHNEPCPLYNEGMQIFFLNVRHAEINTGAAAPNTYI